VGGVDGVSAGRTAPGPEQAPVRRGVDHVEVSHLAMYLSKLKSLPAVRQDLIDSVREQLAQGGYDTPEKLEAALDQLLDDL
jgi:hypothetical protein